MNLPPDLAGWKLIRRDGVMFALSSKCGCTHSFPDDAAHLPALVRMAREAQRFALAVDPVTGQRRTTDHEATT
jgi:hypothetical protein